MPTPAPLETWSERLRARWRRPRSTTALLPVAGTAAEEFRARIAAPVAALPAALAHVADLHSFRLAILPPDPRNGGVLRLLFNTVHDAPPDEHLAQLFVVAGAELGAVFAAAGLPREPEAMIDAVAQNRAPENTFYLGAIGKSVPEILGEARLREALGRRVDARLAREPWPAGTAAETIRRELRDELRANPGAALPLARTGDGGGVFTTKNTESTKSSFLTGEAEGSARAGGGTAAPRETGDRSAGLRPANSGNAGGTPALQETNGLPLGPPPADPPGARLLQFIDLLLTMLFPAMGVLARDMAAAIARVGNALERAATWVAWGLWWLYGGLPTGLALAFVRAVEALERDIVAPPPDPVAVARFEAAEDLHLKNSVTLYLPVKPWWTRRLLLCVILWGSERGTRHFWTAGALADIDTIHYARIFQVDRGRSMLFLSDYDGSLNRYLDDFIGVGSRAVIPISSNLAGCPPTSWLFGQADPATFDGRWRGMIRRYQLEEVIWYSAYPDLAVREVRTNARIRAGLVAGELAEDDARDWLRLL